ncbi:MAG: type II toxin-antitoxin system RelE/ParE family toxin [Actinomycetota bacterium]|nr:type II toxin-antitoxin system RelE/ParE family toxin [Actinomycetota bacterium]
MPEARGRPAAPRAVLRTTEFRAWTRTLGPERRAAVQGAIAHVAEGGPTRGRPHVDVIHGSKLHKLKEARISRSVRLLFAFDSRGNAVMLLGGDKAGKWNRWYPKQIERAERLYADHERNIGGKEPPWQSRGAGPRGPGGRSR